LHDKILKDELNTVILRLKGYLDYEVHKTTSNEAGFLGYSTDICPGGLHVRHNRSATTGDRGAPTN
jgi:hypothetical protein